MRYEWKSMAEAGNNGEESSHPTAEPGVAVVVPLFPKLPGIRESLASLATQTRPPELVVLLDDGSNPGAESLHEAIPSLEAEVVQVEPGSLASALDALSEYLANFDFVSFLLAGDAYEPGRIAHCLQALLETRGDRVPCMALTGILPVDSRGKPLPADDPRAVHVEQLWAPGRAGAGLPDWLGAGYFAGPASNIFVRRDFLTSIALPENPQHLAQVLVLSAALQGLLEVVDQPLLRHYPPLVDRSTSLRAATDSLQAQLALLLALRERLAFSPDTRRNLAAYHRAAWNSLSGLREDLFQQLVLQLASSAEPEAAQAALATILRSREAATTPAHWAALFEGKDRIDAAGYADALRRTGEKLQDALDKNERLTKIAEAAQDSGWVRFGAWLGERSARRMMEMEQEEETDALGPDGPAKDEKAETPPA